MNRRQLLKYVLISAILLIGACIASGADHTPHQKAAAREAAAITAAMDRCRPLVSDPLKTQIDTIPARTAQAAIKTRQAKANELSARSGGAVPAPAKPQSLVSRRRAAALLADAERLRFQATNLPTTAQGFAAVRGRAVIEKWLDAEIAAEEAGR